MNTNSIETQQNAYSLQDNLKIADIYQKMLSGDKSALSSLQKVKILPHKPFYQNNIKKNLDHQNQIQNINKSHSDRQKIYKNQHLIESPPKIPVQQKSFQNNEEKHKNQMNATDKQSQKQKQKFRSYIKKKVHQLRTEKQILKSKGEKETEQIKKNNQKQIINRANQSKSYDLVKRKEKPIEEISSIIQQAKKSIQAHNTRQNLKKVQSSSQHKAVKHLPPLKQKKKIPTQNSQNNSLIESNIISRKQVNTPVNLANSKFKIDLETNAKSQNSIRGKQSIDKAKNLFGNKDKHSTSPLKASNSSKVDQSRIKKISLPEMKKARQEYAAINQAQKNAQFDIVKYHQQTKNFLQQIKSKYQLNFRNQSLLIQLKKQSDVQPISNKNLPIKGSNKVIQNKSQAGSPENKKKKMFEVIEQKISQAYKDIALIDNTFKQKKHQLDRIQEKISRNLLFQYWEEHDLQNSDFEDSFQDQQQIDDISSSKPLTQSNLASQAYSTAMPNAKDKQWKSKVIKQYDTNRSFQQYAKSRMANKPKNSRLKSLNKIEQDDELQQSSQNRVTVNSRLKKLLLH